MKAIDPKITQAQLKEILHYDPETGVFTWKVAVSMRTGAGMVAGGINATSGYRTIRLGGLRPTAQRVAHLYMTGSWPESTMDHINGDRADNRWCNLRAASAGNNAHNAITRVDNSSGVKGVFYRTDTGTWVTQIRHNRVNHRKNHATFDEACDYVRELRTQLHGEFARHQ